MPRYFYVCTASTGGCGFKKTRILRVPLSQLSEAEIDKVLHCEKCGRRYHSDSKPPTTQVKEILDNGIMSHRIERLKDVEQLSKERARNDPSKKK